MRLSGGVNVDEGASVPDEISRSAGEDARPGVTRRDVLGGAAALGLAAAAPGIARAAAPEGQLTWGMHVSVAPTWFDPAETQGIITPYMVLYALHDAMVKDMPGKPQAPCLAESWSTSEDNLTHEFVLRPGVKFHDGEPVTAEDVKFSFERYHGTSHDVAEGEGRRGRNVDRPARPLQAEGAVARFSDVLFERERRRLDRAEEIRREGRRRGVQEAADRRRAVQIRVVQPRGRAGARSVRRLLAQDAERQAPGHEGDPRRGDARGGAEARRGRHRLFDPRRDRRGDPADTRV